MNRRRFLTLSAAAAAATLLTRSRAADSDPASAPDRTTRPQPKIPRWRGFNLTELTGGRSRQGFRESDFEWMAGWGLDFARLPCSYWAWSTPQDWMKIDETALKPIDDVMALGKQYKVHLNLGLHRIPGYCVNGREREPYQLFDGPRDGMDRALEAAVRHWRFLARRYKDVPTAQLSFDLFNEPPFMADHSRYIEVAKALITTIREESPDRLIFADGIDIGQTPVLGLLDEGIVQSTRGYLPKMVSHYTATWVPVNEFESLEVPTWPMVDKNGVKWDREKLRQELISKWQPLIRRGAPVHVGEWGCYTKTPHAVCLAWMGDMLSLWKENGWGWSMWNLRGGFGIVDSGRPDVQYEDFKGHKLDRKMLELLLAG